MVSKVYIHLIFSPQSEKEIFVNGTELRSVQKAVLTCQDIYFNDYIFM